MNFEWSAIPIAIVAWIVLETLRFLQNLISKKIEISREYRMEIVRKRCDAYRLIYGHLFELIGAAHSPTQEKLNKITSEINDNVFYLSARVGNACHDLTDDLREILGQKRNRQVITRLRNRAFYIGSLMREEIYDAKIENEWGKGIPKSEQS